MSVEQTRVVDAISIDRETGQCKVSISDHLPWDGDHLLTLQEKLNAYLAFLESGEVYSAYPQATGREFSIIVIAKYRPNDIAMHFFEHAAAHIKRAGFSLRVQPLDGAYYDDAA
jgi:hypothetical protein